MVENAHVRTTTIMSSCELACAHLVMCTWPGVMHMNNAARTRLVVTHTSAVDELRRRLRVRLRHTRIRTRSKLRARDYGRGGQLESLLYDHATRIARHMITRPHHINKSGYTHECARITSRTQHTTRARDLIVAQWSRRVHYYAQHPTIA